MRSSTLYIFSPLLFFMLYFRASMDPILNLTKVGGIGFGALLNLLVVVYFMFVCLKNKFVIPKSFFYVWGAFILIGLFSIFQSPDKVTSLRSFFAVLTYFSIFNMSYYFCRTKKDVSFLVMFIVLSAVVPFGFSIFEIIFPDGSTSRNGFRLSGSFSHPNIYAFYLVLVSSLCFFSLNQRVLTFPPRFIQFAKVILLLSLVCLVLTKTRSAWLGFIVVIAVYGMIYNRRYLLYLTVFGLIVLAIPSVQERVLEIFSGNSVDELTLGESLNSYAWRKVVWTASWDFILQKPLFGHGYDTFSYYFLDFFPLEENKGFDAHNTYVQIAFDMGFLGALSYLLIFPVIFYRVFVIYSLDRSGGAVIIGLMVSYLVVGYSDNMLFYLSYNWYFWLVLGAFFYASRHYKVQRENE
ncbi:O-antigen ligase family protein [Vibrio aquaticus]|uniref:O-antigen ligase family protein n=2 Tax=Vibrio aquaticus TaxID=2496559 RepID=A0A3S0MLQ4_9VIBR|nr:O-antigen ligase family protein [Vibrio aquaticus]